jgi:predicted amidophosphoribosyltransferase
MRREVHMRKACHVVIPLPMIKISHSREGFNTKYENLLKPTHNGHYCSSVSVLIRISAQTQDNTKKSRQTNTT